MAVEQGSNGNSGAGASGAGTAQNAGAQAGAGASGAEGAKAATNEGYKLPEDLMRDGKPDVDKVISKFSEYEAERAARGAPPETPDKYEFAAPKDLKLPDGTPAEIDVDSDIYKQFRQVAHDLKLPQEQAQKLFDLGVEMQFGLLSQARAAGAARVAEEVAKLGSKGAERLNNVGNWFKANWGDEGLQFLERLSDHRDVILAEKIIAKFGGAGASGASRGGGGVAKAQHDLAAMYPSMAKKG